MTNTDQRRHRAQPHIWYIVRERDGLRVSPPLTEAHARRQRHHLAQLTRERYVLRTV